MAGIIGLITVNHKQVLEVDADPSAGGGTAAPKGSMAMYDDGSLGYVYIKTGAADTAWSQIDTPENADWKLDGNTVVSEKDFGTLDDFDVPFIRNSLERMRLVNDGLLIGLSASIGGRLQLAPNAAGDDILKQVLSPLSNPIISVSRMHRLATSGAASATFDLAVPSGYNAQVKSNVVARQTAGTAGDVGDGASYERTVHARNLAGTVAIFQQQSDYTYEVDNQLQFALSANTGNVRGTVTGVADRDISWGILSSLLLITT